MRVRLRYQPRADWPEDFPILLGYREMARALQAAGHEIVGDEAELHLELDTHIQLDPNEIIRADHVALWCHHAHNPSLYDGWVRRNQAHVYVTDRNGRYAFDRTSWLPNAAPIETFRYDPAAPIEYDICFIGRHHQRITPLRRLERDRPDLRVFINDGAVEPMMISTADAVKIMQRSRIVFNAHTIYGTLSSRIAEAMACGKPCVTDVPNNWAWEVYQEGLDYHPWATYEELCAQVDRLLAAPPDGAELRRRAEAHGYANRIERIMSAVERLACSGC